MVQSAYLREGLTNSPIRFTRHTSFPSIFYSILLHRKSSFVFSLHSQHYPSTGMWRLQINFKLVKLKKKHQLSVPGTSSHGAWPPGSLWPSGSGRVRFHQWGSPGSGPRRQRNWARLWVLQDTWRERGEEEEARR